MNEKSYKLFVNDTLLMDLFYPSKKLLDFGYVSIGGCTADVFFDDIEIINWDTVAPPELKTEEPPVEESSSSQTSVEESSSTQDSSSGGCGSTATSTVAVTLFAAGSGLALKRRRRAK